MPLLFSVPSTGRRVLPNQWDLIAFAVIMAALTAVAHSYHGISAPLHSPAQKGADAGSVRGSESTRLRPDTPVMR